MYNKIFQKCNWPDMLSWIRHYVAEVCDLPSALLVGAVLVAVSVSCVISSIRTCRWKCFARWVRDTFLASCLHVWYKLDFVVCCTFHVFSQSCSHRSVHLVEFHQAAISCSAWQVHALIFVKHFVDSEEFSDFYLWPVYYSTAALEHWYC